ncbi:hypothetical protein EV426DRAFT_603374 [Tirmania nivea]|nr:hypothetical protein EV426DRAFT_603374 [Tirmania nivea]
MQKVNSPKKYINPHAPHLPSYPSINPRSSRFSRSFKQTYHSLRSSTTNISIMQLFTVTTLTLSLLTTLTLADYQPICHTTVYTCKGNFKCCTMPLQTGGTAGVAAYCMQGNMPEGGCPGTLHTICCEYDAEEALTPRGYTFLGCSEPGRP